MFQKIKHLKIILPLIIVFILGSLLIPEAYAFYQAQKLNKEGDLLLASNQYQPALEKCQQSKEKWEKKYNNLNHEEVKRYYKNAIIAIKTVAQKLPKDYNWLIEYPENI